MLRWKVMNLKTGRIIELFTVIQRFFKKNRKVSFSVISGCPVVLEFLECSGMVSGS